MAIPAKNTFLIFMKFLRLNKRVAVRDFPGMVHLAFQPPVVWSTPLFLESGNCKRSNRLLSDEPNTGRFTESHKNEPSRKAMLATHSGTHSGNKVIQEKNKFMEKRRKRVSGKKIP